VSHARPTISLLASVFAVAMLFAACGSTNAGDLLGGGAAPGTPHAGEPDADVSDDASLEDASSGNDAAKSNDARADRSVRDAIALDTSRTPTCDQLLQRVDALRPRAIECIPNVGGQCDLQIDDVCCPASINSVSSGTKPVKDFRAAVAAFVNAGCQADCLAIACIGEPSEFCEQSGLGGQCEP
jgi:hypothetical protein